MPRKDLGKRELGKKEDRGRGERSVLEISNVFPLFSDYGLGSIENEKSRVLLHIDIRPHAFARVDFLAELEKHE